MIKIAYLIIVLGACAATVFAHQLIQIRDLKAKSFKIAKILEFSREQKSRLNEVNTRYSGKAYDKNAYREEFYAIMTEGQKEKLYLRRSKRFV